MSDDRTPRIPGPAQWRAAVKANRDITGEVRALLIELSYQMNQQRKVSIPQTRMAEEYGVSLRTIRTRIEDAHRADLLSTVVRGRPGMTAVYQGIMPSPNVVRDRPHKAPPSFVRDQPHKTQPLVRDRAHKQAPSLVLEGAHKQTPSLVREGVPPKSKQAVTSGADETFTRFWLAHPRAERMLQTREAFDKACMHVSADELIAAAKRYGTQVTNEGTEHRYIVRSDNWLTKQRYTDRLPTDQPTRRPNGEGEGWMRG